MEFTLAPRQQRFPGYGPDTTGDDGFPFFVFPPILPPGGLRGVLPGRLFSQSHTWRSWVPKGAEWVLPWTLIASSPGVLHVAIDVASYHFSHLAVDYLKEQAELIGRWASMTLNDHILATLYPYIAEHPELVPPDGDIRIVVEVPPMHLRDP